MPDLVIEYVLDSKRPGYNYTSPTAGYTDGTLKEIWRGTMPRGQGWRGYIGARSMKCFPIDGERRVAISDVTVTDQSDEHGRRGIRHAAVTVLDTGQFLEYLALRLAMLPETAQAQAAKYLTWLRWKRIIDRATPKMRKNSQIVFAAPFTTADDWQTMEALVLTVATAIPTRMVKGWPSVFTLTTLALDHREEARIVAIPEAKAKTLKKLKPIRIS